MSIARGIHVCVYIKVYMYVYIPACFQTYRLRVRGHDRGVSPGPLRCVAAERAVRIRERIHVSASILRAFVRHTCARIYISIPWLVLSVQK
jgi:hypothetical protein